MPCFDPPLLVIEQTFQEGSGAWGKAVPPGLGLLAAVSPKDMDSWNPNPMGELVTGMQLPQRPGTSSKAWPADSQAAPGQPCPAPPPGVPAPQPPNQVGGGLEEAHLLF